MDRVAVPESRELTLVNPLVGSTDVPVIVDGEPVPPPQFGIPRDASSITGPVTQEQQQYLIGKLWLQGYGFFEIAEYLKLHVSTVRTHVTTMREVFRDAQNTELLDLAAERVTGFALIKTAAWEQYEVTKNSRWLQVIMRAEELMAKLQGVLSDKVLHLHAGEVVHKLYDFTASAYDAIDAKGKVLDDPPS